MVAPPLRTLSKLSVVLRWLSRGVRLVRPPASGRRGTTTACDAGQARVQDPGPNAVGVTLGHESLLCEQPPQLFVIDIKLKDSG